VVGWRFDWKNSASAHSSLISARSALGPFSFSTFQRPCWPLGARAWLWLAAITDSQARTSRFLPLTLLLLRELLRVLVLDEIPELFSRQIRDHVRKVQTTEYLDLAGEFYLCIIEVPLYYCLGELSSTVQTLQFIRYMPSCQ
jgi:hypothetical protein